MKILVFMFTLSLSLLCIGKPKHHRPIVHHHKPRVVHHHKPHVVHHHKHKHNIVGPFIGGVIGGYILSDILKPTPPVVVSPTPIVVQQPVMIWKPGHYENRVQPNGVILRVWVPGQYIQVPST